MIVQGRSKGDGERSHGTAFCEQKSKLSGWREFNVLGEGCYRLAKKV